MPVIPRPEYPRPQFMRKPWINLNGAWTCELDHSRSGYDASEVMDKTADRRSRRLWLSTGFAQPITVPFCPESRLSGVGYTDFIEMLWYHRKLTIPNDWNERILLHFGAVDYQCDVFVDGVRAGRHAGGQCAFAFDIAPFVKPATTHDLVLCVRDNVRNGVQPAGKQSPWHQSRGCHYTRVTGIWQTVWMESVPHAGLQDVHIIPDLDQARFHLIPRFWSVAANHALRVIVRRVGEIVTITTQPQAEGVPVALDIPEPRPWAPGTPHLYDIEMEVIDSTDQVIDRVTSYAGLRKIHCEGNRIFLNNRPLYQRLVLDQGYYPDGIWTAPSDEALRHDIELAQAAGFNGARLHQKVFEPRFHYWADRLGYLTWGEAASWGCNPSSIECRDNFLREWREIVQRDRNHPSIITWTPWNEVWEIQNEEQLGRTLTETYEWTKALDPTRPVNTASGGAHCRTDIWSLHCYGQKGEALAQVAVAKQYEALERIQKCLGDARPYAGEPVLLDEFGGIKWQADSGDSAETWGYGETPQTTEAFYARLDDLTRTLAGLTELAGFCYTQLTDVEQEVNGLYTYDRKPKFDVARLRALLTRTPTL